MNDGARARVTVSGRVQGVFFRQSTRDMAERLGVCGWVRNLPDGRVAVLFEGPAEAVRQAIAWCGHGPPAARVDDVTVSWEDYAGDQAGFRVTY